MNNGQRARANKYARSDEAWAAIRDSLVLALDQLDTGQMDRIGTASLVAHLRPALRLAHRRLEAMQ